MSKSIKTKKSKYFDKVYSYNNRIIGQESGQNALLETYGKDFEKMLKIYRKTPRKVWTLIDGSNGELMVIAGVHFVNRVAYLISRENWKNENEEYFYFERD